jgi:hypothetical protein
VKFLRQSTLLLGFLVAAAGTARAQQPAPAAQAAQPSSGQSGGWQVSIYPILAWLPTNIDIETSLPPTDGGGGSGGSGGGGKIVDSRFDGAYLGGLSVTNGTWRVDGDVVWAAIGGDRIELPALTVDVDLLYGHASLGRKVVKNLFVTGGVRRMALKYDVKLTGRENFTRKPGLWDPVVGGAWHQVSRKYELHAGFEGGGFGVGSDWEYAASVRGDWKPVAHFGLTAGYSFLSWKMSHDVAAQTFTATQTLHGPVVGFGLYF